MLLAFWICILGGATGLAWVMRDVSQWEFWLGGISAAAFGVAGVLYAEWRAGNP